VNGRKVHDLPYPRDWAVTTRQTSEGVEFNVTEVGNVNYKQLQFRNQVAFRNATNSSCPKALCVRQSVWVEDYAWQSDDLRASLVLMYWLSGGTQSNLAGPAGDNRVSYADAWLTVPITAEIFDDQGQLIGEVGADLFSDPSGIWLSYSHFTGSLFHKPVFGMGTVSSSISLVIGLSATAFLIFLIVFCAMYYTKRRRQYYELID